MSGTVPVPAKRWRGPPLAFQILGLLIGGLVVAQLVTLFLTILLPPSPPVQYGLDDIAAVLRGDGKRADGLQRIVQAGPPDISGPGWLVSERSRKELAALLGVAARDVSLSFYTPLPFAGSALPPPRPRMADDGPVPAFSGIAFMAPAGRARLILAQAQAGPPPFARPSGEPPGRGGAFGNGPPPRDTLPPGIQPGGPPPGAAGRLPAPAGAARLPRGAGTLYGVETRRAGGIDIPGDGGVTVPPLLQGQGQGQTPPTTVSPGTTRLPEGVLRPNGPTGGTGQFGQAGQIGQAGQGAQLRQPGGFGSLADQPGYRPLAPPVAVAPAVPAAPAPPPPAAAAPAARPAPPVEPPALSFIAPPPAAAIVAPGDSAPPARPSGPPIAVTPPARGLFGFAPAPFVEGDFVAALRLADGRWSVVQPAAEPFPNAWQRRLLLWFAVAFAIVAPLGWLFARRLVKPLAGFALAAERLGRDPAGAVIALDGPAEMGRAARAFNLMQGRLRSFVDDRTAMVGAISHDLRTPLTRLRFRIEDVPDDQREGMLEEVVEMEAMISSVLDFIRDASTPNARERLDLRTLVDDVVEDAVMIGSDVTVEEGASATVEVDVLGMRRVLDNLLENAVKYGVRARVRLRTEPDAAVAEIFDDGPGLPDDELERVFEPFYRSEAALTSGARGSGLGLAVCRSITRAHGGDVRLLRSSEGFVAQVRVPLAA